MPAKADHSMVIQRSTVIGNGENCGSDRKRFRGVVGMGYGVSPNDRFGFAKLSTECRKILEKALK
jgi:hypothetical protein